MNEKKSKRLRQLVKHLMGQGAIAEAGWVQHTSNVRTHLVERTVESKKSYVKPQTIRTATLTTAEQGTVFGGTVRLDAACGRAIYQQMKKRAHTHRAS